jgi:pyrrolidone-carboxylate peptidase
MKLILFSLFFSTPLWARPVVLVGHFDAFGKAPFNNSEKVAKLLSEKMKDHPDVEIRICALRTVFDKSFFELQDCYKDLPELPKMVLGLGESNCNFKIETMARNKDSTIGPDNEGTERNKTPIVPEGPAVIGFLYPLAQMYCSLLETDRRKIEFSNDAGSFICNNLAYQFSWNYPEQIFGFIHVPSNHCQNLEKRTLSAVANLERMILAGLKVQDVKRLLTSKKELQGLRSSTRAEKCLNEFYKRTKGVDERGFWSF